MLSSKEDPRTLGIQTWNVDTRLSEHAKDEPLRLRYPNSIVTSDLQAHLEYRTKFI